MAERKGNRFVLAAGLAMALAFTIFAGGVVAWNFSDSTGFSDSGYFYYGVCSVSTSVAGSVAVGVSPDSTGTSSTASPTYPVPQETTSSTYTPGIVQAQDHCGAGDPIWVTAYSPQVTHQNVVNGTLNRIRYYGGTSLQNAYAAMTQISKNTSTENGLIGGTAGSYQNVGPSVEGVGQAANIGGGVYVDAASSGGTGFSNTTSSCGVTYFGNGGYASGTIPQSTTVTSFGPNPVAMSYGFTTPGNSSSNYSGLPGTGSDNTIQVPVWPVSLVYDSAGNYVGEIASACGSPAYVKDARGGSLVGSQTSNQSGIYWASNGAACGATSFGSSSSYSVTSPAPPTIEGRPIECKNLSGDLATVLCGGASSCGCSGGIEPTVDNLAAAQSYLNGGYTVKTYNPVQAAPDPLPWPATDPGFGYVQGWASTAYVTFTAGSCGPGTGTGGNQLQCDLGATPNPQDTGQNVVWTTTLYKMDASGNRTQWNGSATYNWQGSDNVSTTTSNNSFSHAYQAGGQQYMTVNVSAEGQQATCSNTAQVNSPFSVTCSGTPNNATLNPSTGQYITWQAFPTGGNSGVPRGYGNYTYSWSLDPASSGADLTQQTVTAMYNDAGQKNAVVTVTDSTGKTVSSQACSVQVNTFNVTCFPDKAQAYTGDTVTWTAAPYPGANAYSYAWTGTDSLPSPNSATNQATYSTTGQKTASVTVTFNGINQTVQCGSVNILGPKPTTPSCALSGPAGINPGDSAVVTANPIAGFNHPITSAVASCGDSATSKDSSGNDTSQACTQPGTDTSALSTCSFSCNNYAASPASINLTLSNNNGETATCSLNYGTTTLPPSCSLTPTPQTITTGTGQTAIFTLGFSNFTATPSQAGITATCMDGTTTNQATITNCNNTQCTATCPTYKNTGGQVTASVTSGTQNATCTGQADTASPPTCSMTSDAKGPVNSFVVPVTFTVTPINFNPQANAFVTGYPQCGNNGTLIQNSKSCQNNQCTFKCTYNNKSQIQQPATASAELQNSSGAATPNACTASVTVNPQQRESCTLAPSSQNVSSGGTARFTVTLTQFPGVSSITMTCPGASPNSNTITNPACSGNVCNVSCTNYQSSDNGTVTASVTDTSGPHAQPVPCTPSVSVNVTTNPVVQSSTTNYAGIKVLTAENKVEYERNLKEPVNIIVNVTKLKNGITGAVFNVLQTTPQGITSPLNPPSFTADLSNTPLGSYKTVNVLSSTSDKLQKGVYTYEAIMTSITVGGKTMAPGGNLAFNADANSIAINDTKTAVPEIPPVFVLLIVLTTIALLRMGKSNLAVD